MKESDNYRKISIKLTTSGSVNKEDLLNLSVDGYEAIINLLPDTNKNAVKDERQIVEAQGIKYFHIPVDFGNPTNSDYEKFKNALTEVNLLKTHIHCAANWRVSAFYAVYAYEKSTWSAQQAWTHVTSVWQVNEHPVWIQFLKSKGLIK